MRPVLARGSREFRAYSLGVFTEGGHWPHDWFLPSHLDRRQERVDLPGGGSDLAPAAAGIQLRVAGEFLRRAEPRAGDSRPFQETRDLLGA